VVAVMTEFANWVWLPIVLLAAAAQTVRNAAQRSLTASAGTLPATLVRFVYGLPFAALALLVVSLLAPALPSPGPRFLVWVTLGAVGQLAATAFLLQAMEKRSFVVAVAYSKTEIVQIAIFSIVLLGERISIASVAAIAAASVGVVLLSVERGALRAHGAGLRTSSAALWGIASGGAFALAAVGYRGATTALDSPAWVAGIYALVWAQSIQTILLGAYLAMRDRAGLMQVVVQWRVSTVAGFMGTLASAGWLTAFALRSAVDVRIAGLVELLYSYALSRKFFRERVTVQDVCGILLVLAGIVVISVAP
jgi:drug/metabolite transporter (DMT)-like permease